MYFFSLRFFLRNSTNFVWIPLKRALRRHPTYMPIFNLHIMRTYSATKGDFIINILFITAVSLEVLIDWWKLCSGWYSIMVWTYNFKPDYFLSTENTKNGDAQKNSWGFCRIKSSYLKEWRTHINHFKYLNKINMAAGTSHHCCCYHW